jgi:hypothetical protein
MISKVCRSLTLVTLFFAGTAVASDREKALIRGLWSLTTQADSIRLIDVRRELAIQPEHYTLEPLSEAVWEAVLHLQRKYRDDDAATDSVTDVYLGISQLMVFEGPPGAVRTRQKVEITFKSNACVSAKSVEDTLHIAPTEIAGSVLFKSVSGRMESTLELDADCVEHVLITKIQAAAPLR